MSPVLAWDQTGEKIFETGVNKGVLYVADNAGGYPLGVPWNGLVSVTQAPSGAEPNKQYADNIVYANLISAEEFAATIEAFTFPDAFAQCDGTATPTAGVAVGQQTRKSFGLSYRTTLGNDTLATDFGYKLHLIYGGLAAPTEKAYSTINDSPEAMTMSWEVSTSPVSVSGLKPTAILTINSTKVQAAALASLEQILYGTAGTNARLPLPDEVIALFSGAVTTSALPVAPTYTPATDTITFAVTTGVDYRVDGAIKTAPLVITKDTIVTATPKSGFKLPATADDDWLVIYS